jgi:hypothetical protein
VYPGLVFVMACSLCQLYLRHPQNNIIMSCLDLSFCFFVIEPMSDLFT